jgi:hypothetical protein
MKRSLIVILVIVASIWLGLRIFSWYKSGHVMGNEAVFEVYMDVSEESLDAYFEKGIYDPEQHTIICKLPTSSEGFKPNYVTVRTDLSVIDCKQEFDNQTHIKYESYELNQNSLKLYIVKKTGVPLSVFNESAFASSIVASTELGNVYRKGRINRIYISKDGVKDYCD